MRIVQYDNPPPYYNSIAMHASGKIFSCLAVYIYIYIYWRKRITLQNEILNSARGIFFSWRSHVLKFVGLVHELIMPVWRGLRNINTSCRAFPGRNVTSRTNFSWNFTRRIKQRRARAMRLFQMKFLQLFKKPSTVRIRITSYSYRSTSH